MAQALLVLLLSPPAAPAGGPTARVLATCAGDCEACEALAVLDILQLHNQARCGVLEVALAYEQLMLHNSSSPGASA